MESDAFFSPAEPQLAPAPPAVQTVKYRVYDRLVQQLDLAEVRRLPEATRRTELRQVAARFLAAEDLPLTTDQREQLLDDILDELVGLGPLDRLLRDPEGGDILVNGPHDVWVEKHGQLMLSGVTFRDDDHLLQILDRIVARVGRRLDDTSPMVDARLPDGSRLNAIIPPLSLKGPSLSIRRFSATPLQFERLVELGSLTQEMAYFLQAAVQGKLNIIVSGGTGSGKTTLLNCLSSFIPEHERIITIEDAAELRLQQRNVLPLETRPPNLDGKNAVTMRDLVRNALRMRPDRIVVGECRGPEALDMLQAMNSGHEGSLTTLHANSPRDALARLETMLLMAGYDMPLRALRRQIVSAVHLIVQADRLTGGPRRLTSLTEIVGMEGETIVSQEIFRFQQQGVDAAGKARGRFLVTGVRPAFCTRLEDAGIRLPPQFFTQRALGKP
ncbi:MAG: CpaF family protein [Gemmataceae bacterium]